MTTYESLMALAERCFDIVKGHDPDQEELAKGALLAGEPDIAIGDALGAAYKHPELCTRFPDEVYELAKDPDYGAIHPYLDLLERHRGDKAA